MRKIERQMISAVKDRKDWRNDNTEVLYSPSRKVSCVYLHKNLIATISKDEVETTMVVGNQSLPNHVSMLSSTDCVMATIKVYIRNNMSGISRTTKMVLTSPFHFNTVTLSNAYHDPH